MINLSYDGFLYDPESEYGHIHNPDVVPFESIMSIQCLVLLGEPGIGKTRAMQTEKEAINTKIKTDGGETLWLDLSFFGDEYRLVRDLFENETFISWKNGKHQLHIFLDSLDECQLRIDTVAGLLIYEIKKYSPERLFLRIACRTADWPSFLENDMEKHWGENCVLVYELAPLRRKDISEAAEANGLDPIEFLKEINRKEIVPLAIKPITLDLLLNIYQKTHQFPSTQTELYSHGCRLLCAESNPNRRHTKRYGVLTAEQRMAIAARIAFITAFANRYAIWIGLDQGDVPDEDVQIQDLCGGNESINENQFLVNEEAVSETLATGLFVSSGPNRLTWAHRTYAEFLASYYLVQSQATLTQILDLMIYPGDPNKKIVPQLAGVAAWLADMVPDVFRANIEYNPEILLRSGMATIDIYDKAKLTESLLNLCSNGKLQYYSLEIHTMLRKLAHPGLAEQIKPYLLDNSKYFAVRELAIDIVETCKLQELFADLLNISLNPSEPIQIRESAARALKNSDDNELKTKLKPLATNGVEEDTDDQLKGYSLSAIWPKYITAEELFKCITPPKQEFFGGSYSEFLNSNLVQNLNPIDLHIALKWVEEQVQKSDLQYSFEELINKIMLKAWEYLESPHVLEAFSRIAFLRLQQHEKIIGGYNNPSFSDILNTDTQKRREIIKSIVPMLLDPEKDSNYLVFNGTPLVIKNKDTLWLIECFQAEKIEKNQLVWTQLIWYSFDSKEAKQLDAILNECSCSPMLAEKFQWCFKPVELNSPEAQKMKDDYFKYENDSKINQTPPTIEPTPSERIAKLLDDFYSGKLDAWWQLNLEITLQPNSTHCGDELESDITILYGWETADSATKEKIVNAAKIYLTEYDLQTPTWLDKNTIYRPAYAGYRAIQLLLKEDPNYIIHNAIWEKWAPVILTYSKSENEELVKLAYNHAPNEIIQTISILIDRENEEHGCSSIIQKVKHCLDERLTNAILIKANDKKMKPDCMGSLLKVLLENKNEAAEKFAESLVSLEQLANKDSRLRAVVAAKVLMNNAVDCGWEVVWPTIQKDIEFGKEVISALTKYGFRQSTNSFGHRLTEEQLADLYIWVVHQYPYSEDPKYDGAYVGESRKKIATWRNSILQTLKMRGTHKSCEAISRISSELPDLDWLKLVLLEAQNITHRNTWVPPQPRDILKIVIEQQMYDSKKLKHNFETLLVIDKAIQSFKQVKDIQEKVADNSYSENYFRDLLRIAINSNKSNDVEYVEREGLLSSGRTTDLLIVKREGYDIPIEVKILWRFQSAAYEPITEIIEQLVEGNFGIIIIINPPGNPTYRKKYKGFEGWKSFIEDHSTYLHKTIREKDDYYGDLKSKCVYSEHMYNIGSRQKFVKLLSIMIDLSEYIRSPHLK